MRKQLLYTAWAIGGLFAACSSEETPMSPDQDTRKEVRLEIAGPVSRTTTSGSSTTFVEGDAIGISSTGLDMDMNNAKYTVTSDGSLTGGVFYYDGDNKATFYAHYPYTASYSVGKVSMTVPSVQSTETAFNAADFMTATAIGDPTGNGAVKLQFKHRLALVKVVWSASTDPSNIQLQNVKSTATWTQSTDACVTSGELTAINMWKQSGKKEFWALIPEQNVSKGTDFILINDGSKDYVYTLTENVAFSASTVKKITLSLKQNTGGDGEGGDDEDYYVEATISTLEIGDWGDESEQTSGTVEEIVVPPVELISADAGKNIILIPNSKDKAVAGEWNLAIEEGESVIEVLEDRTILHFNLAATNKAGKASSWWNNAVYYRPTEALAGKIKPTWYKLSFKAKASAAGKGFMVQVMKGDEASNTYFGIVNADPSKKEPTTYNRMYYPSFKEEQLSDYVTMNYWVHFGKIVSTDGKTVTEGKAGDYEKVLLTLSINTGTSDANAYGVDFWFKDFTWTEVK